MILNVVSNIISLIKGFSTILHVNDEINVPLRLNKSFHILYKSIFSFLVIEPLEAKKSTLQFFICYLFN